ncbi:hypothetical protein OJAV_G00126510 [Oryzias javanicus]|uniref:Cilia- and flagella-associated protein 45 n=1 Tax=Oryzias javanicus TaxID=123683 RepID=A0A3S2P4Z4_ORYJA|nr:hypothetical protein OJAV_G00126510 [Oryzias javanicus]
MPSCRPKGAETLHGNPKKDQSQENNEEEKLLIITKDFIRTLRIPRKEPQRKAITLPSAEFEQIISTSRFLIKEEREALRKTYEKEKEEKMIAAEEIKCQIQEVDLSQSKDWELSDLELEAQTRARRLVEQANDLKMEEEDEIKQLNQLILGTQCQATGETSGLHDGGGGRKPAESLERLNELRKQKRIRGRQEICDQIQQNLEERQIREELKEQEKLQLRKEQENRNREDLKALEKKLLDKKLLQEEIVRLNAEVAKAKERRTEEEKQADLRAKEYLQKKLDREAEYEAEQKRIKKEKEVEIARLRAQQQRAKDYKAEQDEIRAKRRQEAEERKWRQKEKEMAIKKARDEATLRAARLEQVQNKEYCLSIEAGREKATFERVLKVQQEKMAKQKEEEEKKRQKAQQHAQAIRQQVKERELSAAAKRKEMFKEADRRLEEAKQRQSRLAEIKEKKLQQLRAIGLSEKYCAQVERKAEKLLHPHLKN